MPSKEPGRTELVHTVELAQSFNEVSGFHGDGLSPETQATAKPLRGRIRGRSLYTARRMNPEVADTLWRIGLILLLVALTAFFVAAEFSLVGVRKTRIESLARGGSRPAARLTRQLDSLDAYISATQLGITLASLALGWVGEEAVSYTHLFALRET